jgi:hypothetical protein
VCAEKDKSESTEAEAPNELPRLEEPKNKISNLLSRPTVVILTLFGLILTLIGFPLSIYFYYAAKEYPHLTYYVHPVKATIVRAGEASKLTASIDNKPVETDITAAQLAIWNQGRRSIKKDQVLKPIVIYTENNAPILEATIRKSSRDVTQLSLNTDELHKGRVTILWNILEQNDGGIIQLIYAGNTNVRIKAEGVVEGQPQIEQLEFTGKIKSPYEQYESERQGYRYLGYLLLALGILLVWGGFGVRKAKANYRDSFDRSLKSRERYIESLDGIIKRSRESIADYDDYIKQMEEYAKEREEMLRQYKESEGESSHELLESMQNSLENTQELIAGYKETQEAYRKRIREYESEKEKELAREVDMYKGKRKEERLYDVGFIIVTLLAALALIPAIYLLLIAKPIGPPFGF